MSDNSTDSYHFLNSGGVAASAIRQADWAGTTLADIAQWDLSLRITLRNMLHSALPAMLLWGEEQRCFYNDAFAATMQEVGSKAVVGIRGCDWWQQDWKLIEPLVQQVLTTGNPLVLDVIPIPIFNDVPATSFDGKVSFSVVSNDQFSAGGIMINLLESIGSNQLEKELAESEDRFKTMAESTDILVSINDETGNAIYFNQAWNKLTGLPVEDLMGYKWADLIHHDDREALVALYEDAFKRRVPYHSEFRLLGKSGDYHWLLASGPPRYRSDGSFAGYIFSAVDITERKQAEEAMAESEARFRSLIEQAPVATGLFTGEDLIIEVINQPLLDMFGKGDLPKQQKLLDAVPELAEQPFPDLLRQVLRTGEIYEARGAKAVLVKDGIAGTYYFDFSYKPIRNASGDVYAVLDMAVDVTAEVLARKKLEESEAHLELLRNTVPAMIFYLDEEQRYQSCNETFLLWFNVTNDEVIGKTVREFIGEAGYSLLNPHLAIAYSGQQEKFEIPAPPRLGIDRWLSIVYTPHITEDGKVIGVIVHATDVTQSKQVEQVLRESEARFRSLADNSPIFVFVVETNSDTAISYWNSTWLQYTGQSFEQATGGKWNDAIHPDDVQVVRDFFGISLLTKAPYYIPAVRVKRYDGEYRWHAFKGNPRYLENGEFMGYVGVGVDIHDQKITEEKLEDLVAMRTDELQRSNSELKRSNQNLEDFAYAASHDLKEPVRKIQFFTNQLKEQLGGDLQTPEMKSLERIQKAAKRMGLLIDDLLLYSHVSQLPVEKEKVDLNEKLNRVQEDLELDILEKKATLIVGELPVVNGYRRQLQQLFQNLVSNALKYSKQDVPPVIEINASITEQANRRYYRITVADNGIGFEQEYSDTIFQMFSRLHGQSEYSGTGIGLSIVKKVVENHAGTITAQSSPGEGAVFVLMLPVAD